MKEFKHHDAKTVDEASALLAEYRGKAAVIAGGSDIIGVIKSDIIPNYPEALVNIKTIAGLDSVKVESGVLKIGALTTIEDIAENATIQGGWNVLSEAALSVAAALIRTMGTLGGNLNQSVRCWYYRYPNEMGGRFLCFRKGGALCYAVPGDNRYHSILGGQVCFAVQPGDTSFALSALNATIVTNKRSIPIDNYYVVLGNVLAQDEFVVEVQVPTPAAGTKQAYTKFRYRRAIDWAITSVASCITTSGGTVSDARITLGGVAPVPWRSTEAENVIKGKAITEALAVEAGTAAVADAFALSDNAYKIQVARTLVKRAILG